MKDKNNWQGDLNATTVNLPDFKVVEDNGNVIGWIKSATGEVSLFRIRFNHQDGGSPGADNMVDPAPSHIIDSTYVSINNIAVSGDSPIPHAAASAPWAVASSGPDTTPGGSAVVEIEGVAGSALSSLVGPGPLPSGQLTKRTLRVTYAAAGSPAVPDTAVSGGSGIALQMSGAAKVSAIGATAKLRSKKGIDVTKGDGSVNILDMTGEAGRDMSLPATGLNATLTGTVSAVNETLNDGQDFYNLKWSDVPVASNDETKSIQLPGGVYVTGLDGKVRYYDVSPDQFKTLDQTTGCVTISSTNFSEVRTPTNLAVPGLTMDHSEFTIKVRNAEVDFKASANGNKDVLFTVPSGRALNANDTAKPFVSNTVPSVLWNPGNLHLTNATASCPGNLTLMVNVKGRNGSLTSGGNAIICAPSVDIAVDANVTFSQRLSIYSKGDLTVSTWMDNPALPPYVPAYKGYAPLKMQGLIYAWGNADVFAGTPGALSSPGMYGQPTNYGNVSISGALVAYGDDPSSNNPGADGKGKVSIFGEQADIVYDSTKLISSSSITPGQPLTSIHRVSYGFEKK